jgi:5-methylcytosine-specific restriction protein A
MTESIDYGSEVARLAEELLPYRFRLTRRARGDDGVRFSLVCDGDGWTAEIRSTTGWRRLLVEFEPRGFARAIVRYAESRLRSGNLAELLTRVGLAPLGGVLDIRADSQLLALTDSSEWPTDWQTLTITALFSPIEALDPAGAPSLAVLLPRFASCFRFVSDLLPPLTPSPDLQDEEGVLGLPEGGRVRIEVNGYERDPRNREACLAIHGFRCSVCGTTLVDRYGPIAKGYMQVHHLVPLSSTRTERKIDPGVDLVPVCPNCHAMLHRTSPPLRITELQRHLTRS